MAGAAVFSAKGLGCSAPGSSNNPTAGRSDPAYVELSLGGKASCLVYRMVDREWQLWRPKDSAKPPCCLFPVQCMANWLCHMSQIWPTPALWLVARYLRDCFLPCEWPWGRVSASDAIIQGSAATTRGRVFMCSSFIEPLHWIRNWTRENSRHVHFKLPILHFDGLGPTLMSWCLLICGFDCALQVVLKMVPIIQKLAHCVQLDLGCNVSWALFCVNVLTF